MPYRKIVEIARLNSAAGVSSLWRYNPSMRAVPWISFQDGGVPRVGEGQGRPREGGGGAHRHEAARLEDRGAGMSELSVKRVYHALSVTPLRVFLRGRLARHGDEPNVRP